jgi:hypothetical protein
LLVIRMRRKKRQRRAAMNAVILAANSGAAIHRVLRRGRSRRRGRRKGRNGIILAGRGSRPRFARGRGPSGKSFCHEFFAFLNGPRARRRKGKDFFFFFFADILNCRKLELEEIGMDERGKVDTKRMSNPEMTEEGRKIGGIGGLAARHPVSKRKVDIRKNIGAVERAEKIGHPSTTKSHGIRDVKGILFLGKHMPDIKKSPRENISNTRNGGRRK